MMGKSNIENKKVIKIGFLYVGIGGFIGSCIRYSFTIIFKKLGFDFPLSTLVSNVIAGLLIGFVIGIDRRSQLISSKMKLFLTTGILGGLSTFSTFSLESVDLFASGKYQMGMLNVFLNFVCSFLGVCIGMMVAKLVVHES